MSDSQTRQEFEQSTAFVGYTFSRDYNGDYSDKTTYHAWLGWIAGRSAGLEEAAQIGIDYLGEALTDDEYWAGGRQYHTAVAKYVEQIRAAILQRKEGKKL